MSDPRSNSGSRVPVLDALRGFAILGICIVNIRSFAFSYDLTPQQVAQYPLARFDKTSLLLINIFLDGKFYSIFSLLFGMGFSIYLSKLLPERQVLTLFARRLFVLFLLGAMHVVIWRHDTLMLYALLGACLIPFKRVSNKAVLITAAIIILSPILWCCLEENYPQLDLSKYPQSWGESLMEKARLNIVSEGDYLRLWKKFDGDILFRLRVGFYNIFFRASYILSSHRIWKVFGMFLIGLVTGRLKLHQKLQDNKRSLWLTTLFGLLIGLPCNFIWPIIGQNRWTVENAELKQTIAFSVGVVPLALAYCSLFCLLYMKPFFYRFLNIFSAVGKMALTNYIMQTVIGVLIFSNFGLGVHYVGVIPSIALACSIFVVQVILSNVWLRFFNYGPLEWLWRSLTYVRSQPTIIMSSASNYPNQ